MKDEELENRSLHVHLAYFGSELACPDCNPACHENHGMGKTNNWCGHYLCPMHPRHFKKVKVSK